MESKNVIVQTIRRLKEIKSDNGLTNQQIVDKINAKGYYISDTTVKRVFSAGSEKLNFRYQDSIAPIAEVLFEEYGDTSPYDYIAKLREVIRERDREITRLMIKIDSLKDARAMCDERKKILDAFIMQLQDEVELLKDQIKKKDAMFEKIMSEMVLK